MQKPIIHAQDLCFRYDDESPLSVDHVTLDIYEGQFVTVLGRNGSGKSTFAKLLNALLLPLEGTVTVADRKAENEDDCYPVREVCGMVFQNPDNQIVATIVEEDCAFGLENLGIAPSEIRKRVDETLAAVGMSEYAKSSPSMLSGGQKQRVAIAGVLAMKPKIIVFDESTAMLDPVGRKDIFALARKLNREENITIVWITHFMEEAAKSDRVIVMDHAKVVMDGTPVEVFSQTEQVLSYGLDVPEMMRLGATLKSHGIRSISSDIMSVEEMAEAICRLKSNI